MINYTLKVNLNAINLVVVVVVEDDERIILLKYIII